MTNYPGKLITFEGVDRAGKSSIVKMLPEFLNSCKVPIVVCSEKNSPISNLLGYDDLISTTAFMKTFLFATDRAWSYEKFCIPALKKEGLVLWDRYIDSAIVYRNVEFSFQESIIDVDFVKQINRPFINPDLTFIIDISIETSAKRAIKDERMEAYNQDFLRKVRREYLNLSRRSNCVVMDGEKSLPTIIQEICAIIQQKFKDFFYEVKS